MRRLFGCCLLLVMLTGCAAQQSDTQQNYYAMNMPSLSTLKTSKAKAKKQTAGELRSFNDGASMADIRKALLSEFDLWSGTPYRFGGESKGGIDCSALVQQIYRDSFDIELPRSTTGQVLQGRRIDKSALQPGDLVFFKPSRRYHHVGIYVGDGLFLHASSSQGVKLSRLDNPYWTRAYWQSRRPLNHAELALRSVPQGSGPY